MSWKVLKFDAWILDLFRISIFEFRILERVCYVRYLWNL